MANQVNTLTNQDVMLDLYKIHAYHPNDAEGNPLTPFGNFSAGYEAAKQHYEREIAELKSTVKKWQENSVDLEYSCLDKNILITELQVNNNRLREALELAEKAMAYDVELVKEALSKTPAQCLQEHDNEVIEMCAKVCDRFDNYGLAVKIRVLKVTND